MSTPDNTSLGDARAQQDTARTRQCHADTVGVQWRRRRQGSYRLPPKRHGQGSLHPQCTTAPALTDRCLDGWRDAALHVLGTGLMPVVPIEVCRALWRRGGPDRALSELVCGQAAA